MLPDSNSGSYLSKGDDKDEPCCNECANKQPCRSESSEKDSQPEHRDMKHKATTQPSVSVTQKDAFAV